MTKVNQHITKNKNSNLNVLEYFYPDKVRLNLPFILTCDRLLTIGMPYMKTENWLADSKTEAIRLLDIWDTDGIVYLKIQSLITLKIDTLSWNLEYTGRFWLWSLADFQTLIQAGKRRNSTPVE